MKWSNILIVRPMLMLQLIKHRISFILFYFYSSSILNIQGF